MKTIKLLGRELLAWGEPEETKVTKGRLGVFNTERQGYAGKGMSLETMRNVALSEPLVHKGIWKKNNDTVRNWFILKAQKEGEEVPARVVKIINEFDKQAMLSNKLRLGGICSNVYGTGFIERTFVGDEGESDSPVDKSLKPLGLNVLNSEYIKRRTTLEKRGKTKFYEYKQNMNETQYFHPDRIIEVTIDKLPHKEFGVSIIHVLNKILTSKMNADVSSGELLNWYGSGMYDVTITDMDDEQEQDAIKKLNKHPDFLIHDQDYVLNVQNPTRIDPQPFFDYFVMNIAAALKMPTHMLTGIQIGNVTGSEVGFSDYIHDVENIQKIVFTPILEGIYRQLLESYGLSWKYKIYWNPIYVDELSEAKTMQTRAYSAQVLKNAGIVDTKEARMIINEGMVHLDIDKTIKEKKPEMPISNPNIEPQPVEKKPTTKMAEIEPLTEPQRRMIQELRDYEKLQGKLEEIAQEKRLKYAEEQRKKQLEKESKRKKKDKK